VGDSGPRPSCPRAWTPRSPRCGPLRRPSSISTGGTWTRSVTCTVSPRLEWTAEVERVDAELGRLVAAVPADTAVYVTADHGMLDVPFDERLDLAAEPQLLTGVRHVGGEARAVQLLLPAQVRGGCRRRLAGPARATGDGDGARDDALRRGCSGPPALVADRVLPRIGDVIVNCLGTWPSSIRSGCARAVGPARAARLGQRRTRQRSRCSSGPPGRHRVGRRG
jgi:hypothetical protein